MSYPKQKAKFDAWHKAMVAGATVDKPDYGKTRMRTPKQRTTSKKRRNRRKRRQRRIKNG